jgi:uncharacterized protein (DUF3084 family)
MAARKKTVRRRASDADGARAFTVVLEQIRADNRVFGEALGTVREELGAFRHEFDVFRQEVGAFRQEFDAFRQEVGQRFDGVEGDLGRVKDAIGEHGRQLRDLRAAVDRKVDRDEVEGLVERAVARAVGH